MSESPIAFFTKKCECWVRKAFFFALFRRRAGAKNQKNIMDVSRAMRRYGASYSRQYLPRRNAYSCSPSHATGINQVAVAERPRGIEVRDVGMEVFDLLKITRVGV